MSKFDRKLVAGMPLATVNRVHSDRVPLGFCRKGRVNDTVRGQPQSMTTDEKDQLIVAEATDDPFHNA